MNTQVTFRRPSHRNRYGEYQSKTLINCNGINGNIKISLVWFNSLGWYYTVELTGWKRQPPLPTKLIQDYSNDQRIWRKGKELSLCAKAAEEKATEMLAVHEITGVEFEPYILPRKF